MALDRRRESLFKEPSPLSRRLRPPGRRAALAEPFHGQTDRFTRQRGAGPDPRLHRTHRADGRRVEGHRRRHQGSLRRGQGQRLRHQGAAPDHPHPQAGCQRTRRAGGAARTLYGGPGHVVRAAGAGRRIERRFIATRLLVIRRSPPRPAAFVCRRTRETSGAPAAAWSQADRRHHRARR